MSRRYGSKSIFNRTITPHYVGDEGYDLQYDGYKIEVKTVTSDDDNELKVPVQ
jgi:hypothetical protein